MKDKIEKIAAIVHQHSGLDSLTWIQLHEDFKKKYRDAAREIIKIASK